MKRQVYVQSVVKTPSPQQLKHARLHDMECEKNSARKASAAYKKKRALVRKDRRKRDRDGSRHGYGEGDKTTSATARKPAAGKAKSTPTHFCGKCKKPYILAVPRDRHQQKCTVQSM